MRLIVATFVGSVLAGLSNAYTQPVGSAPIGNPFRTPELNEQVPKGTPFKVTWDPTIDKAGTVTILLLHGPSTNAVPMYPIAQKIPNSGSFEWTPSADLAPESTHYGLQLIVDATGQYQYTPQFGISGAASSGGVSSSYEISTAPAPTSSAGGYPTAPVPSSSSAGGYPTEPEPSSSSSAGGYPTEPEPTSTVAASSYAVTSGTAVPPAPSSVRTSPMYVTSTMQVTTCTYPSGTGAPVPPGTGNVPIPVPPAGTPAPPAGPPAPGSPAPPAGTYPAGSAPAASGTGPAPAASDTGIATAAAGKTVVASGIAIAAALLAFAL
ncbi:MAG: hypothetical protein MMC23_002561 [Stictis urceolatum]|nr:hypothetical protein [Stictis urceolata]